MVQTVPSAIEEAELRVDGVRVFYRRVPGEGTPTVYCHGNPTHGEDWVPFLERGGDPFLKPRFAEVYAAALPGSQLKLIDGASHWPWIDDARVIDEVRNFVA
jgi:pimeloyl-ACP methyl ester carboxylesterase